MSERDDSSLAFVAFMAVLIAAILMFGGGCGGALWPREIEIRIVGVEAGVREAGVE
jgi:hypothetical protein